MLARARDPKDKLVEDNLGLVWAIVRRMKSAPPHVDRREMFSAGCVGLVECAQRYNPERGIPFTNYAARRIEGAIQDFMRGQDWCTRLVRSQSREVSAAREFVGGDGSPALIADMLGITTQKVAEIRAKAAKSRLRSLDEGDISDPENQPLYAFIKDPNAVAVDEQLIDQEIQDSLRRALSLLPERYAHVVRRSYYDEAKSVVIADELGVSESRISQMRKQALGMMRDLIELAEP